MLIQTNVTNWYPRHNKPVPVYRNLWLVKQECMDLDTPTMWKIRPGSDNRLPFTKVHTQLAETIFLDTNISGTFGRASKGPLLTCSTYLAPIYLWLGSWDARCFFGHVFPHIMGASLCLQFFIILIYLKHARYIFHTVPVGDEKPKKKILKKSCSNNPSHQQYFSLLFQVFICN